MDKTNLRIRVRRDYTKAVEMMGGDGEVFLPNMGPRDAYYARMRIVKILVGSRGGHWHVTSYPASYNGQDGYFFKSEKIED